MLMMLLLACSGATEETEPVGPLTCPELLDGGPSAIDEAGLRVLLDGVLDNLFPELEGVSIELRPNTSDSSYFSANPDLSTLDRAPLERDYFVQYSTLQFDSPPPADAVTAILAHELKHVRDYTEMSTEELAEFGLWYISNDISEYERATDEHSLELGCGEGLILFREWLYAHVTPEVEAQKRIDYYTPEEIEAWMAANP